MESPGGSYAVCDAHHRLALSAMITFNPGEAAGDGCDAVNELVL